MITPFTSQYPRTVRQSNRSIYNKRQKTPISQLEEQCSRTLPNSPRCFSEAFLRAIALALLHGNEEHGRVLDANPRNVGSAFHVLLRCRVDPGSRHSPRAPQRTTNWHCTSKSHGRSDKSCRIKLHNRKNQKLHGSSGHAVQFSPV